jgi:hypothetical protein
MRRSAAMSSLIEGGLIHVLSNLPNLLQQSQKDHTITTTTTTWNVYPL